MALYTDFEIKEFNAASLTAGYQVFGAVLTHPCYEAEIVNESNVAVYISVDGTNNSIRVGAGMPIRMKGLPRHDTWSKGEYLLKEGTQLYIKQVTGAGTGIIVFNALMTR